MLDCENILIPFYEAQGFIQTPWQYSSQGVTFHIMIYGLTLLGAKRLLQYLFRLDHYEPGRILEALVIHERRRILLGQYPSYQVGPAYEGWG